MSVPMVRELFRGLETTLHERLSIIEELLRKPLGGDGSIEQSMQIQRPDPAVLDRLAKVEAQAARFLTETSRFFETYETMLGSVNSITNTVNRLYSEVAAVRESVKVLEASHTASAPIAEEVQRMANPMRRAVLGQAGREAALAQFSWAGEAQRLVALYGRLTGFMPRQNARVA
jgi:hypothetical protein